MKRIVLMRHAKSDWKQPGTADHDRPLNKRGRKAAPLMGSQLREQRIEVDTILASSAARVQETLEHMLGPWNSSVEVTTVPELYMATPQVIANQIQQLPDSCSSVMVVGHNPGMCALVSHLAGEGIDMPTAAVAVFDSNGECWADCISEGDWRMTALWRPKELHE